LALSLSQIFDPQFSGLTPDVAIFVLGFVLSSKIYLFLIKYNATDIEEDYNVFCISAIAIGGITVNLVLLRLVGLLLYWYV
jgi:hypothetical protein